MMKRKIICIGIIGMFLLTSFAVLSAKDVIVSQLTVSNNTFTVDDDGEQCSDADFTNIQNAINAASDGDTIEVYAGTYFDENDVTEGPTYITSTNVIIDKSINLVGEGDKDSIKIVGISDNYDTDCIIFIKSDDVVFTGFNINNGNTDGIYIKEGTNNVTVIDNVFSHIDAACIHFYDESVECYDINIVNNEFKNLQGGISINTGISAKGINIEIKDNEFSKIKKAIRIYGSENLVKDNIIVDCDTGIGISCDESVISDNYITECMYGLSFIGRGNNEIFGNTLEDNEFEISISNSEANKIYHNNFIDNKGRIMLEGDRDLENNVFNLEYSNDGCGNYWSDYEGGDSKRGEKQNHRGSDGIGDEDYNIYAFGDDEINKDKYPWMKPDGVGVDSDKKSLPVLQNILEKLIIQFPLLQLLFNL